MAATLTVLAPSISTIDASFSPAQTALTGSAMATVCFLTGLPIFIPTRFEDKALASS